MRFAYEAFVRRMAREKEAMLRFLHNNSDILQGLHSGRSGSGDVLPAESHGTLSDLVSNLSLKDSDFDAI